MKGKGGKVLGTIASSLCYLCLRRASLAIIHFLFSASHKFKLCEPSCMLAVAEKASVLSYLEAAIRHYPSCFLCNYLNTV
ncbi:hypothetical protein K1719_041145 [Acacia pycnantha]|nr:hypothetical protein K1719_041145 [Acacia pycnantha]